MFRALIIYVVFMLCCIYSSRTVADSYKITFKGNGVYAYQKTPISLQIGECVTLTALSHFPTNGTESISWKRDTHALSNSDRATVSGRSVRITSLSLKDHAYYQVTIVNKFSKVTEITDIYLHVRGCEKYQKQLPSSPSRSCQSLCEDKCPKEWAYVIGTDAKCCQYFGVGQTWSKASESCQAIGGELATIDNAIENRFISDMLKTAAGAWIGLNDRETESKYVWNFQQSSSQTYFTWGSGEPSNYNKYCNIENCITIKSTNGKWNDVVCGAFYPYVCQVSSNYNGSDVRDWTCIDNQCYKLFPDRVIWIEAATSCKSIDSTGSLAAISSSSVNNLIQRIIKEPSWIGLNDLREAGEYDWEGSSVSYSYKNWDYSEPNDMFYRDRLLKCPGEDCVQIKKFSGNVTWHDLGCDTVLPYICERIRDRAFSTGAYVAIVIGSFLLSFMIIGLAHAAYQKRQRTAVKDIIKAAYQENIKLQKENEQEEIRQKLSFRSAARMVLPRIRIQPQ